MTPRCASTCAPVESWSGCASPPALAGLAEETRALWSHALVEAGADGELAKGAGLAAGAERVTEEGSSAPALVFAAPGEDVSGHACDDADAGADSGTRVHRIAPDDPNASFEISGLVTTAVIRQLLGTRLLLHAGAVVHPELGTVLVVGPSGAGKSTSTTALGQGATYLTDELTILDPHDRRVTAHPKPVSRVLRADAEPAPASGTGGEHRHRASRGLGRGVGASPGDRGDPGQRAGPGLGHGRPAQAGLPPGGPGPAARPHRGAAVARADPRPAGRRRRARAGERAADPPTARPCTCSSPSRPRRGG